MSPEEFDNRLKSSFQDEYLPPKENLWVNISTSLDQKAKTPVWHWLLPVLVAFSVSIIWLGSNLTDSVKNEEANVQSSETSTIVESTSASTNNANSSSSYDVSVNESKVNSSVKQNTSESTMNESIRSTNNNTSSNDEIRSIDASTNNKAPQKSNDEPLFQKTPKAKTPSKKSDLDKYLDDYRNRNNNNNFANSLNDKNKNSLLFDDELITFLKAASYPNFSKKIVLEDDLMAQAPKENKSKNKAKSSNNNNSVANLESSNWLSFGFGPQISYNSLNMNNDSQEYIHKHLWENRDMVTRNGSGINSFLTYSFKFGKTKRFSFETGLLYSLRTEIIRFNKSTEDIALRDNSNKVQYYVRGAIVYFVVPRVPGPGNDTTYYNAVQNFSMDVTNKYSVLTIPLRFNFEQKIKGTTFFSLGLGAGLSMISSKSTKYYDMVYEKEKTVENQRYFTGSLNTQMSFYTRFNDVGQIGIYSGFQTYLKPWTVNNKQYSINMSDLQFGIMFKRPF